MYQQATQNFDYGNYYSGQTPYYNPYLYPNYNYLNQSNNASYVSNESSFSSLNSSLTNQNFSNTSTYPQVFYSNVQNSNVFSNLYSNYQTTPKFMNSYYPTYSPASYVQYPATTTVNDSNEQASFQVNNKKRKIETDPPNECSNQVLKRNRSESHYTMNSNGYYECEMCQKEFESQANVIMHKHIFHNKGDSKQCPICFKSLYSYSSTLFHIKIHTKEKNYNCEYCRATFTDSTTLKRHIRTHTGERPYKCSTCNKAFTQSGNLKRHMKVHEADNRNVNQNHSTPQSINTYTNQFNLNEISDLSNDIFYNLLSEY